MPKRKLSEAHHPRPQWRSRMGFILAALGSAVGLGNIWRFSYLCYKNGGGAFLIPYAIALLTVGLPLMILELGVGHKMRGSPPLTFAKISRKWEWCGWWAVNCAMYGILLYYSAVIAWCLSYVFFSFNLSWGADPNDFFFNQYLQISAGPLQLGDLRVPIMFSLLGVWFLSWLIVFFGVQKGVERANKIFMPLLFCLVAILVIWSVQLKGAGHGIAVYLKPNMALLKSPQVWIDAFSQIFFTLSLAFGIMIAYASYLPRKASIIKDALIITFGNSLFSFFSGFAVFGTLGYMAYATQQPISEVVNKSIGLAFVTYPQAISLMPAFKNLFGILFFASLVIAGLSSAVSLVETFCSAIIDKFNFRRKSVVTVTCLIGFVASIIFTAKSGLYWVDIIDHFITHYGLVTIGILECVIVAWILKTGKLKEHISRVSEIPFAGFWGKAWSVCIRFVTPLILVVLIINDLGVEFSKAYEGYPVLSLVLVGRDWLLLTLIISLVISMYPWKKEIEEMKSHQ
jgi:NSS family neurotransmitter:Na+ symporter